MPLFWLFGPPNVVRLKAKRNVAGLIKALGYKRDFSVRRDTAKALGEIGDACAVEPLIAALNDKYIGVGPAAAEALGKIGDVRAVEPLIAALKKDSENVGPAAAEALGKFGDVRAVEPLIAALKLPYHYQGISRAAADALFKIGAPTVEPLIAALNETDAHVAVADVLDRLGWQPDQSDHGVWYWIVKREFGKCVEMGAPAVEPLIAALKFTRWHDWERRADEAAALVEIGAPAVEPLIAALKNGDSYQRRWAVIALGKIGDARVVEPLIAALKNSDEYVRRAAAEALVKIGAPTIEPLIAALNETDASEAVAGVLDSLGWQPDQSDHGAWYWIVKGELEKCVEIGAPAVEPLITALKNSNKYLRRGAVEALGKIGDARAVEPLIATLNDSHSDVRKAAAEVLGEIGDGRAIEALIVVLINAHNDPYKNVRLAAAKALGKIGDVRAVEPLIAALKNNDEYLRRAAAEALVKIGAPTIEPLIAALNETDASEAVAGVLDSLGWQPDQSDHGVWYWIVKGEFGKCVEMGAPAVEPLIAAYSAGRDNDPFSRGRKYSEALSKISDVRAVEPLIAALKNSDEYVRRAAAEALVKIGAPTIEPLIAALNETDASEAVAGVLDSLGWQPDQSDHGVWYWIVKGELEKCVEIGAPAVEPLIATLNDSHSNVREAAAEVLGEIGDARAVEPLIAALNDSDRRVREVAAKALGKIGDARAVKPLMVLATSFSVFVSVAAAAALAEIGTSAVEFLIDVLSDSDREVRWVAAKALGEIGDARAVEPLIAMLNGSDEHRRWQVAEALGKIGDARAVEPLIAMLNGSDEHRRWQVAEALGKIGDARAVEPLIAMLNDSHLAVRRSAAEALDLLSWEPTDDSQKALRVVALGRIDEAESLGASAIEPLIFLASKRDYRAISALSAIGGTKAIGALIRLAHDPEVAETILDLLNKVIEKNAPLMDEYALRAAVSLSVHKLTFVVSGRFYDCGYNGGGAGWVSTGYKQPDYLDCTYVRQIARQELIRRGLIA